MKFPYATRVLMLVASVCSAAGALHAQVTLTRPFEAVPGERSSVVFGVTAPGQVSVQVASKGEPVVVAITAPDGRVSQQQGAGAISLSVATDPGEMKGGTAVWTIAVSPLAARGRRRGMAIGSAASGTVTLSGPLMSEEQLQAALQPMMAALSQRKQAVTRQPARSAAQVQTELATLNAPLVQQRAQAQQRQLAAISAQLPAPVVTQMQQRIVARSAGDVNPTVGVIIPRAASAAGMTKRAPMTTSVGQAASGATPVGTVAGAAVAAAPALARLSVSQGEPGTAVLLDGSAFGDQPGEVHFIIGAGKDLIGPVTFWAANQVVTEVPAVSGVPASNGFVYLQRADGSKTSLLPFAFQPTMEVATMCLPSGGQDMRFGNPGRQAPEGWIEHRFLGTIVFVGYAGYDELFVQQRLLNGWTVTRHEVMSRLCETLGATMFNVFGALNASGAYMVDSRVGTDSPYARVRWWVDPFSDVEYQIRVTMTGPKGLPYR